MAPRLLFDGKGNCRLDPGDPNHMDTCATCQSKAHARAEGRSPSGEPALRITYECGAVREWRKPGDEWQFFERLQSCGRPAQGDGPTAKVGVGLGIPTISGS